MTPASPEPDTGVNYAANATIRWWRSRTYSVPNCTIRWCDLVASRHVAAHQLGCRDAVVASGGRVGHAGPSSPVTLGGAMTADIVIRGGTVVDGTGAPGRTADVAITDGVITEIGAGLDGQAGARGRRPHRLARLRRHPHPLRRPGLLGPVAHARRAGTASPRWSPATAASRSRPVRPEHRELLVRTLQHVEDMAPDTLFEGVPWDRLRDLPAVLRRDRSARHAPQLRLLRRPHRGAPLRDGRGRATSSAATDDDDPRDATA